MGLVHVSIFILLYFCDELTHWLVGPPNGRQGKSFSAYIQAQLLHAQKDQEWRSKTVKTNNGRAEFRRCTAYFPFQLEMFIIGWCNTVNLVKLTTLGHVEMESLRDTPRIYCGFVECRGPTALTVVAAPE